MSSVAPDGRAAATTRGAWLTTAPARRTARRDHRVSATSLFFVVGVTVLLIGLAVAMSATAYDIWGGMLVGTILLLATVPIATRAARRWDDPGLGRFLLLGAFLKMSVGSGARYYVIYSVYGAADAERYFESGKFLAPFIRSGDFGQQVTTTGGAGTHFIETVSGIVIAVISETRLGEFVVFSWFAFLGLYFFSEAFRIAFPAGDHRRYRLLVFLWPSLLFWPSSVGKEAWMVCMLGMCALGMANLFVGKWRGFAWLAVGTAGCVAVRPHVALIVFAGFLVGLLLRRNRGAYSRMLAQPVGTLVLLVGIIFAGAFMFQQTQSFFKLDSLDIESAQGLLDSTTEQTAEGGSAYNPASPNSPIGYVQSAVTVMFRPFPTEASGTAFYTGLEGVLLAGLFVVSWRRLVRVPRMMLQHAYVAFAVGFSFVFIYAFAAISNFGILARERAQFFPVLFALLAIPPRPRGADALDELDDAVDETALVAAT